MTIPSSQPTVSIIIPTFRRHEYLSAALSSALAQTYANFEVIVTDDDSQGTVPPAVAQCTDPRLRYRRNTVSVGRMWNFLCAVAETRGCYIASLHDDDLWESTFLERLVPYLSRDPSVVLAFAESNVIDEEGRIQLAATEATIRRWGRDRLARGRHVDLAETGLLHRSIPTVVGSVIRRSAIDWCDFPEEVTFAYDLWLAYQIVGTGGAVVYDPERLVRYRVHGGSGTLTSRRSLEAATVSCYDRFLADDSLRTFHRGFQTRCAHHRVSLATALLRAGYPGEARRQLRIAVSEHATPRALGALLVSLFPPSIAASISNTVMTAKRRTGLSDGP